MNGQLNVSEIQIHDELVSLSHHTCTSIFCLPSCKTTFIDHVCESFHACLVNVAVHFM